MITHPTKTYKTLPIGNIILDAVSEETAHVVDDYPCGFRARCTIRFWIEENGNGCRFCSQTSKPAGGWNKPKKSTYAKTPYAFLYINPDNGHVTWTYLGNHDDTSCLVAKWLYFGPALKAADPEFSLRVEKYVRAVIFYFLSPGYSQDYVQDCLKAPGVSPVTGAPAFRYFDLTQTPEGEPAVVTSTYGAFIVKSPFCQHVFTRECLEQCGFIPQLLARQEDIVAFGSNCG